GSEQVNLGGGLYAGYTYAVKIVDLTTSKTVVSLQTRPALKGGEFYSSKPPMTFSPNSELLATGGNHRLMLWDVASGKLLDERTFNDKLVSFPLVFTPAGGHLWYSLSGELRLVALGKKKQ